MRKSLTFASYILFLATLVSGCSSVMALKQPDRKNLSVLAAGVSRDNVVTYLGAPATTERENGKRIEIYQFTQGYSKGNKVTRALFHGLADVATLFIWELIGMPMEAIVDGNKMTVKVIYNESDQLEDFVYLQQAG